MSHTRHSRKWFWIAFISLLLLGGIVWATAELSGQANALAQDSGKNSAEMEELSLAILKKPSGPTPPPCDWQKEKTLRKQIEEKDKKYKELVKTSPEPGACGEDFKDQVIGLAEEYYKLQKQYAVMWEKCNCKSRAKLAHKLADSRKKSAQVVVSEADSDKLNEMQTAQEELSQARREYAQEAKQSKSLSVEDRKKIQSSVIPKVSSTINQFVAFSANVAALLQEVKKTTEKATSGGVGGFLSAAKDMASGGGTKLLNTTKTLLAVSKSMVGNAKGLMQDAETLSGE
ncbi:hypothetical protein [Dethiosulfatarculus sandiegensis]|uniref:Uncharacterized protein n=1 Tax=Dethiosulfatarculus sandiegensis TaxID=1429043 RepID=A0A0D2JD27_9BACT|nr:hypothetical protein [Dethiosulfatarculus sandiegensis]KIX16099.1 hypothetical protein X474_01245 [Dethiosulfatarculus sandiegensis]